MNTRDQYADELVSAYFDGELSGDERARVEQLLTQGGRESQWLEEIESLRRDMNLLPSRHLSPDFTKRTINAARQSAGVDRPVPNPAHSVPRQGANRIGFGWMTAAAALAAALLLAISFIDWASDTQPGSSVAEQDGSEVKSGEAVPVKDLGKPSPVRVADTSDPDDKSRLPDEPADDGSLAATHEPRAKSTDEPMVDPLPGAPDSMDRATGSPQLARDGSTARSIPDVVVANDRDQTTQEKENGVPVATGQLLMVFDVQLTKVGREEGRFDRALIEQQVPFDATLTVDEMLAATLMRSRFLQPVKEADAKPNNLQLVYVVTRGGKIDEIWQAMRENKEHFANIKCDLAIMPADQDVFRDLRQAAESEWIARDRNDQNLVGAETPGDRMRAQRLVLPRTWQGVPAHRLGRLGLMPEWMKDQMDNPRLAKPPVQPVAPPNPPAGQRLGEDIIAEALFVVTTK